MAKAGYSIDTEGAVALAANTAKTVLGAKSGAAFGLDLKGFYVSFDGVTASEEPVLVELCYCTWATNAPETNSTAITEDQQYGRVIAAGFTGGKTWTTEPTTLTALKVFALDPNKGLYDFEFPLGESPDCAVAEGFAIRCTVPSGGAAVNVRAGLRVERA